MTACPPPPNVLDQAVVVEVHNPFDPWKDLTTHEHCEGHTVWEWLRRRHGTDFDMFDVPTICFLNGDPLMRDGWNYRLRKGDFVQFVPVVGDVVSIIVSVIVAIVAAVVTLALTPTPTIPGGQPQPDPVFTRQGQYNRMRLGEPIEVGYGRRKRWPSYAARAYTAFINNDQYQYNLLCIGQGHHDVEGVFIEDTPIENFQEVEYEVIPPGGEVTLFPDNVVTSVEVGGIELYGPNQEEYPPDGWSGGFVVNPSGTRTSTIEIDIIYPNGLFNTSDKGGLQNFSVSYQFQVRLVDDSGNPVGDWTPLVEYKLVEEAFPDKKEYLSFMRLVYAGIKPAPAEVAASEIYTDTRRTPTPQRLTRRFEVDPGRYEVRGRRTSNKNDSIRVANTLVWQAMRAFLPSTKVYGNITLLAVKIRASNNLNDNSRSLINVISTRKLPWYDRENLRWRGNDEEPEDLRPTRSIVLAFCDAFRATYGGALADKFLDIDFLMDLDDLYAARGEFFDWEFDQKMTLWSVAQAIARCGRAVPMLTGSRVSIVRDGPKTIPVTLFNPENIVKDSFKWECKLFELDPEDHVVMTYIDPNTWKEEEVVCVLPESRQENPKRITFAGCIGRDHAYREGLFIAANMKFTRENIVFTTGLEGHIPTYGDLIAVQHDVPKIGLGGFVLSIDNSSATSIFELSNSVVFPDNASLFDLDPEGATFTKWLHVDGGAVWYFDPDAAPYPGQVLNHVTGGDKENGLWIVKTRAEIEFTFGGVAPPGDFTGFEPEPVVACVMEFMQGSNDLGPPLWPTYQPEEPWKDPQTLDLFLPSDEYAVDYRDRVIVLRKKDGSAAGPFVVRRGSHPNQVIAEVLIDSSPYYFANDREFPIYLFGVTDRWSKLCKVVNLAPAADDTVEITCINYDARVHSFDELDAPPLGTPSLPPLVPALPIITGLRVVPSPDSQLVIIASWNPTFGAQSYVIEQSYDGVNWDSVATTTGTSTSLTVVEGELWLRVAAINVGAGPWTVWTGEVGLPTTPPPAPANLRLAAPWTGTEVEVAWDAMAVTGAFVLRLRNDDTDALLRELEYPNTTLGATYTIAMALEDGVSRNLRLELATANNAGESTALTLVASNPLPSAPTGLSAGAPTGSDYPVSWNASPDADFARFKVYASTTPGFAPGPGSLVSITTGATAVITATVTTYWRVAALDVWGPDEVLSAEEEITV